MRDRGNFEYDLVATEAKNTIVTVLYQLKI